jgi:hypothetical protein
MFPAHHAGEDPLANPHPEDTLGEPDVQLLQLSPGLLIEGVAAVPVQAAKLAM